MKPFRQEISAAIFSIARKKNILPDDDLIESGILNSLTIMELAVALEKKLKVEFSFLEVSKENFRSIQSMETLLSKKS